MLRRTVIALAGTALALAGGTGAAVAAPTGTADVRPASVTITYDDSQAAEFADAVEQGVAIWNDAVDNVEIVPVQAGGDPDITVVASDGWPQSTLGPVFPGGDATVWYGREAVDEGYDLVRIAAHELGHSLGLPDMKPGPCSSLMSGSTAGVDCTNAIQDADEIAGVEANYAGKKATTKQVNHHVVVVG